MRSARIRSLSIAVLMAAIALLASAVSASAATIPITGGEVDWGIKQSFREYVKGPIAKGQIEVSGGATEAADGTYKFPVGSGTYDLTTHQVEVQGVGTVHFTGHDMGAGPLLDVTFTNPRVVVGKTSVVYADVVSKTFPGGEVKSYPNAEFALVDASTAKPIFEGEAVTLKSMPTELTTAGSEAFSGFIPPGEELDPLSLTASYAPLVQPEEPKKEEPQSDQPKTDTPTTPAPTVATPKLKSAGGTSQLGSGGSATVATVACQSSLPCQLTAPKSVKFKLGGKSFAAKVVAPKWILAGKRGKVAVKVPKPALEQLGGGKLKIRLKLVLGTGTDAQTKVVKVTLKGKG